MQEEVVFVESDGLRFPWLLSPATAFHGHVQEIHVFAVRKASRKAEETPELGGSFHAASLYSVQKVNWMTVDVRK